MEPVAGLEPAHTAYKAVALPDELNRQNFPRWGGLEPPPPPTKADMQGGCASNTPHILGAGKGFQRWFHWNITILPLPLHHS